MRLLEITRSFYPSVGGLEKFVLNRLKIYDSLEFDYEILTTNFTTEKRRKITPPCKVTYLPQYTPYNITPNIKKQLEHSYDIFSVNQIGRYFADYSIYFARKNNIKVVLTPHLGFHTKKYRILKLLLNKYILPRLMRSCNRIICFTEFEKSILMEMSGLCSDYFFVIPHYFEPANLIDNKINDNNFLFYLGRYENNKRIDLIIKAFNKHPEITFNLILSISENHLPTSLREIVTRDIRIKCLGNIEDEIKINLLKTCSALIYPSDFEAFGISLFEASAYKKPILCSNLEVFKETLNPRGVLFFHNTIDSIFKTIAFFQNVSLSEREFMGEINYFNLSRYSFTEAQKMYERLFKEI